MDWEHALAGAVLVLLARGPWLTVTWRNAAWKRLGWVAFVGVSYELTDLFRVVGGQRVGIGLTDIGVAMAAGALVEAVIWLAQRVGGPPASAT